MKTHRPRGQVDSYRLQPIVTKVASPATMNALRRARKRLANCSEPEAVVLVTRVDKLLDGIQRGRYKTGEVSKEIRVLRAEIEMMGCVTHD